ncbi:MAG: hypothetical protein KDD25_06900, partial [Bdellovibrionales bacterium]|nr:hypothetical protein [Bdellovibrionales bacterium]
MKSVAVVLIFLIPLTSRAETLKDLKVFLKSELSQYAALSKETFTLSPAQTKEVSSIAKLSQIDSATFYFGKNKDGKIEKTCVVLPQKGKEGPMSVGVCYNPDGTVSTVDFLEFNEDRGKAVLKDSFKNQFKGKNSGAG